jgi:Immunity protein 53
MGQDGRMVDRRHLPVFDEFDDHAPGALTWLQAWYAARCDGDWEHGYGVAIQTLDNPGWSLRINLEGTMLEGRSLDGREVHRSQHD